MGNDFNDIVYKVNERSALREFVNDSKANFTEVHRSYCDAVFLYNNRLYRVMNKDNFLDEVNTNITLSSFAEWDSTHCWKKIGNFICSMPIKVKIIDTSNISKRTLVVGGEVVYLWVRTMYKTYKTDKEIERLATSHINALLKDFEKKNKKIDFDIDKAFKAMNLALRCAYGKH